MQTRFNLAKWLAPVMLALSGVLPVAAQSNIVFNGSFENDFLNRFVGWNVVLPGGGAWEPGAADGNGWCRLGNTNAIVTGHLIRYPNYLLSQDLKTVPGRVYNLRFATRGCLQGLKIGWGDTVAGMIDLGGSTGAWFYTNYTVTATSTNTRLAFDNSGGCNDAEVDAVSVRWVAEPPSIIKPVVSRSAYEGATVSLSVKGGGVPPLSYQWHRDGQPMAGQTNTTLVLTNVSTADSGRFFVTITNAFGTNQGLDAILAVSPLPQTPLLYKQPWHSLAYEGNRLTFYTVALSHSPVTYQWRFNDADIPGATNSSLVINTVNLTNAGTYTVVVNNQNGSSFSLPATLAVNAGTSDGRVALVNSGPQTPVYDVDGVTKVTGTNFVAQIYAGAVSNSLQAVGKTTAFYPAGNPWLEGYFEDAAITVPWIPVGQRCYVQVRVWDNQYGESYEEAQARGGKHGKSDVLYVPLQDTALSLPGLASFSLEAGSPLYATAKLDPGQVTLGSGVELLITGEVGTRYLIEYSPLSPPSWTPLMVVTNQTGTVSFVDTNASTNSARIYRAQILSD